MKTFLSQKFLVLFLVSMALISPLWAQNAGPILVSERSHLDIKGGCFCTEYVAYRIRGANNKYDFRHARYWGSRGNWLANNGYAKQSFSTTNLPQNKDVIVILSGWDIIPTYGHVAFVGSSYVQNGTITINVVGANQYQKPVAYKCGCNNESTMPISGVRNNDTRIEIWRKANPALACP